MYQGFAWQHETHWKYVDDTINDVDGDITGSYFQAGIFPQTLIASLPPELEIGARYAYYHPHVGSIEDHKIRDEVTVAANWFFDGHRNKLTAEATILDLEDHQTGEVVTDYRVRLQWDVSL